MIKGQYEWLEIHKMELFKAFVNHCIFYFHLVYDKFP